MPGIADVPPGRTTLPNPRVMGPAGTKPDRFCAKKLVAARSATTQNPLSVFMGNIFPLFALYMQVALGGAHRTATVREWLRFQRLVRYGVNKMKRWLQLRSKAAP